MVTLLLSLLNFYVWIQNRLRSDINHALLLTNVLRVHKTIHSRPASQSKNQLWNWHGYFSRAQAYSSTLTTGSPSRLVLLLARFACSLQYATEFDNYCLNINKFIYNLNQRENFLPCQPPPSPPLPCKIKLIVLSILFKGIPSRANIMVCAIIFCLLAVCTARGGIWFYFLF